MNPASIILESRLTVPQHKRLVTPRKLKAFFPVMKEARITVLKAASGCGKTASLQLFVSRFRIEKTWVRVPEYGQDLFVFIDYLISGVRRTIPEFCHDYNGGDFSGWGTDSLAAYLAGRIGQEIRNQHYFIFDDWHLVRPSGDVRQLVRFLVENTGANVHFIFATQEDIGFSIAKQAASGHAVQIEDESFYFDARDAQRLFEIHLQRQTVSMSLIDQALARTGGWPAGLALIAQITGQDEKIGDVNQLGSQARAEQLIFEYIDTYVFSRLNAEEQRVLLMSGILDSFSPSMVCRIFDVDTKSGIIEALSASPFIHHQTGEQIYRYPALFKTFLEMKRKSIFPKDQIKNLHQRAADYFLSQPDIFLALRHYRMAGDTQRMEQVLADHGGEMINQGRHRLFLKFLDFLDERQVAQNPYLAMHRGCIDMQKGRLVEARLKIKSAMESFTRTGNQEGKATAQWHMARFDFQQGDMIRASKAYGKILADPPKAMMVHVDTLLCYAYCLSYSGRFEDAKICLDKAEKLISEQADAAVSLIYDEPMSFYRLVSAQHRGEFVRAGQWVVNRPKSMKTRIVQYQQAAWSHYHLGEFVSGVESAQKGLDTLEKNRIPDQFLKAWSKVALSVNLMGQGNVTDALVQLKAAESYFDQHRFNWGLGFVCWILAMINIRTGNYQRADDYCKNGLELIKGYGLNLLHAILQLNRVKCSFLQKELVKIRENRKAFENSSECRVAMNSKWIEANHRVICLLELLSGEQDTSTIDKVLCILTEFVQICREQQYEIQELIEPEVWQQITEYGGQLRQDSSYTQLEQYFTAIKAGQNSLTVLFLDGFHVETKACGRIDDSAWNNRKARRLFQYLIVNRHRGFVPKEVLMEMLWPEEDPAKSSKRFHVTLAALRKILQPQIRRGEPSAYIKSSKDAYKIDPGPQAFIDIEAVDRRYHKIKQTDAGIELALSVIELCRTPFLSGELYLDWAAGLREKYREIYLDCLFRIISWYEVQKKYMECVEYTRRYIETEPYDEAAYRKLMRFYFKLGRPNKVMDVYRSCCIAIENQLACNISDQTRKLYEQLMRPAN